MACQTVACLTNGETGKQTRRFRAQSRVRAGDQTDWPGALHVGSAPSPGWVRLLCIIPSCKDVDCLSVLVAKFYYTEKCGFGGTYQNPFSAAEQHVQATHLASRRLGSPGHPYPSWRLLLGSGEDGQTPKRWWRWHW